MSPTWEAFESASNDEPGSFGAVLVGGHQAASYEPDDFLSADPDDIWKAIEDVARGTD